MDELRRYRTVTKLVTAIQLTDDADWKAVARWCGSGFQRGHRRGDWADQLYVPTVHGGGWAGVDDWITQAKDGSFEVLSPEEFTARYEADRVEKKIFE